MTNRQSDLLKQVVKNIESAGGTFHANEQRMWLQDVAAALARVIATLK